MLLSKTLRKKGGIYIKKIKFFLIFILSISICNFLITNVEAESAKFYEGEYINNTYVVRYKYSSNARYYNQVRVYRNANSHEFAYCLEPFIGLNEYSTYEPVSNINYLNNQQIERIKKLAYYGYQYQNHTDIKWYAITQLMIWQTVAYNSGDYYFTNGLNGNRIDVYQNEINELNNLIEYNDILPSFSNSTYNIVEDHELIIEDTNNVLNTFNIEGDNFKVENNKLIINNLKEGDYTYKLKKETTLYTPAIFYQSPNSQDLLERGYCNELSTTITIHVSKTNIELYKTDADTKTIIPTGEATLDGATYNLLDQNHNIIEELVINENNSIINNIDYGKYYIKENKAGEGYTIDEKEYEIELKPENNKIQLILENKVIEKKITIEKKFGENNNFYNEKDISFNIFNRKNELISTITTDSNGKAEIILPYGEYSFVQINSTEGYNKVEPFTIKVLDNEDEIIELKDLKIKVPYTHIEKENYLLLFIKLLLLIICLKNYIY